MSTVMDLSNALAGAVATAARSVQIGGLPLGLAHDLKLVRAVAQGSSLTWDDVAVDTGAQAWRIRREMEAMFMPTAG